MSPALAVFPYASFLLSSNLSHITLDAVHGGRMVHASSESSDFYVEQGIQVEERLALLRDLLRKPPDTQVASWALQGLADIGGAFPGKMSEMDIEALRILWSSNSDCETSYSFLRVLTKIALFAGKTVARRAMEVLSTQGLSDPNLAVACIGIKENAAKQLGLAMRSREALTADRERVWSRLGTRSIQFADSGDWFSTIGPFMLSYRNRIEPVESPLSIEGLPFSAKTIRLKDFLKTEGGLEKKETLGRSDLYGLKGDRRFLTLKFAREGQSGEDLVREVQWLERVKGLGLKSDLPEPVVDAEGRVLLLNFEDSRQAIAFRASKNYYRYLDDPTLSDAEFIKGLKDAIHDIFLLARYDVFHTAPIVLFHNFEQQKNREDGGRYRIVLDELNYDHCLGRLDDWPSALRHGNMGAGGLRDLEELATSREIKEQGLRWAQQWSFLNKRGRGDVFLEPEILGSAYLAATLYIGARIALRAKESSDSSGDPSGSFWKNEAWLLPYAEWLLEIYAVGYAARREVAETAARDILRHRADWLRLARQLAFFMTPAHVPYVREGADTRDFPTQELYGNGVEVKGGPHDEMGRKMGLYRKGTFDEVVGFIGPDGDRAKPSLGPVNGPFPVREFEKAFWASFFK